VAKKDFQDATDTRKPADGSAFAVGFFLLIMYNKNEYSRKKYVKPNR
jgi:hypothetical protein